MDWYKVAAAFFVGAVLILGFKAHQARKARFMTACAAEHTAFECQYRWDTLMARERAANNYNSAD